MLYGKDNYIKDLYIRSHGNAVDQVQADLRIKAYEHAVKDSEGYVDMGAIQEHREQRKKNMREKQPRRRIILIALVLITVIHILMMVKGIIDIENDRNMLIWGAELLVTIIYGYLYFDSYG